MLGAGHYKTLTNIANRNTQVRGIMKAAKKKGDKE
jgi:hypothetical protein